jgi:hypothetical protein
LNSRCVGSTCARVWHMCRYALRRPQGGEEKDPEAWDKAIDQAQMVLQHQHARLANLRLLEQFGPGAWLANNQRLQSVQKQYGRDTHTPPTRSRPVCVCVCVCVCGWHLQWPCDAESCLVVLCLTSVRERVSVGWMKSFARCERRSRISTGGGSRSSRRPVSDFIVRRYATSHTAGCVCKRCKRAHPSVCLPINVQTEWAELVQKNMQLGAACLQLEQSLPSRPTTYARVSLLLASVLRLTSLPTAQVHGRR